MKKLFTLLFTLCAFAINGNAAMWLVGDAFNGWNESGNVQMTQNGTTYTYEASLDAGKYFAFFKDSQAWSSQRGPSRGNNSAPSGDWESTTSGGAWKVATTGEYTIEYNYSTNQAKIALKTVTPFDDTTRKFAVTGAAFGGWNMPPSATQTFTNNGDGTYTLVFSGASQAEFKLSGVGESDTFDSSWSVFNGGCYGKSGLVEGDNTLTTSFGTGNMTFPVNGDVTLTISNVTESSCTLNIARTSTAPANFYILGLNGWDPSAGESMSLSGSTYSYTGNFYSQDENGYAYFSFTTALGSSSDDWDGIASSRWGADADGTLVEAGTSYNVSAGTNAFKLAEGNYTISVNFTSSTAATLTIVNNGGLVYPTVKLMGVDSDWTNGITLTHQGNGIYTLQQALEAATEVKFTVDGEWVGSTDGTDAINSGHHSNIPYGSGNNLYIDESNTYDITLNLQSKTFSFDLHVDTYSLVGATALFGGESDFDTDIDMTATATEGVYTYTTEMLSLAAGNYEYKVRGNHTWSWYEIPQSGNQALTIDAAGFYTVTFTLNNNDFTLTAVATPVTETVAKNSAGIATYVLQNPVDLGATLAGNSGLSIYKVESFDSQEVVLTGVTTGYVPAGTPLLLEYTGEGNITFTLTAESTTALTGNLLKAGEDAYPSGTGPFYVLQKPAGYTEARFFRLDSSVSVPTNRAYLDAADKSAANAPLQAGQKVMGLEGGNTTAIDGIQTQTENEAGKWYNLQGLQVNNPQKGIYMRNGKKVVVK